MEIYDDRFEKQLLEQTTSFYKKKADIWFDQFNCFEYIKKIHHHLRKEDTNSEKFLQDQSKIKVRRIVLHECIEEKASDLVSKDTGCTFMFNERKIDQLKLMYDVFSQIDVTIKYIIEKMKPYINQEGLKIVQNEENLKDPLKFSQKLLQFKNEIDELIVKSFDNNMLFQKARDSSFQEFMNKCEKTPHFLAFYCDNEFKKGFKQLGEPEIDSALSAVVRLFCCLHGRDQFIASYSNLLAQRLLNKTTVSN